MESFQNYFALLLPVYLPLLTGVLTGLGLGWLLAVGCEYRKTSLNWHQIVPQRLGRFLFAWGMPLSVLGFLQRADLTVELWLAPVVAWAAVGLGLALTWLWIARHPSMSNKTQGSLMLVSMVGNTGHFGFPIILLLPLLGETFFAWGLMYDILGTLLAAFGLGSLIAANTAAAEAGRPPIKGWSTLLEVLQTPVIWGFIAGLALKQIGLPAIVEQCLVQVAWAVVASALVLIGLRLQQLKEWRRCLQTATGVVIIKMILVPLVIGIGLTAVGVEGPIRLVLVVMSAMPTAFATLVISERYGLDRDLATTSIGLSSAALLLTLPLWTVLFDTGLGMT